MYEMFMKSIFYGLCDYGIVNTIFEIPTNLNEPILMRYLKIKNL